MVVRNIGNQGGDPLQNILPLMGMMQQLQQMQLQTRRDERKDALEERKLNLNQQSQRDNRVQALIGLLDSDNATQKKFAVNELKKLGIDVDSVGKPKQTELQRKAKGAAEAVSLATGGSVIKALDYGNMPQDAVEQALQGSFGQRQATQAPNNITPVDDETRLALDSLIEQGLLGQ